MNAPTREVRTSLEALRFLNDRIDSLEQENAALRERLVAGKSTVDVLALEEENEHLRRQLGLSADLAQIGNITAALKTKPAVARLLLAMHQAGDRQLTIEQLELAISRDAIKDLHPKTLAVYVCLARKALGPGTIETLWANGYRLTALGHERLALVLERQL